MSDDQEGELVYRVTRLRGVPRRSNRGEGCHPPWWFLYNPPRFAALIRAVARVLALFPGHYLKLRGTAC